MSEEHTYAAAGVDVAGEGAALAGLLGWVRKSHALRPAGTPGHLAVDVGYFASVLELTPEVGLAVEQAWREGARFAHYKRALNAVDPLTRRPWAISA